MTAKLDLNFRPESYWAADDPIQLMLAGVKGEVRRRFILSQLEAGSPEEVPDFMLESQLSDSDRRAWGAIHPQMMGGEYLPEDYPGETTITRVSLNSTTGDVLEVRARPSARGITYRIVDEYETAFKLPFEDSKDPLPASDVIRLLDESEVPENRSGIVLPFVIMNFGRGPSEYPSSLPWRSQACRFARVDSAFYPGLSRRYAERIEAWLDGILEAELRAAPDEEAAR